MTLIEIMVVLAIIGLILGGVGVVAVKQWRRAQLKTAYNEALQIQQNSELFAQQRNRCPASVAELHAAGIAARAARDPWDRDYTIACAGAAIVVASAGPDGQPATPDDITSEHEPSEEEMDDAPAR